MKDESINKILKKLAVKARANIDPAFASGPLATMIGDIATITLYFGVATSFLTYFGLL